MAYRINPETNEFDQVANIKELMRKIQLELNKYVEFEISVLTELCKALEGERFLISYISVPSGTE